MSHTKAVISPLPEVLMTTKLGSMVTYIKGHLRIKSYDPFIM